MEQSLSWEANTRSASHEIPRLVWNPKVQHRVHKSPPLVPILNHINLVHTLISCFLNKTDFNIIVLSTARFPTSRLFPSSFLTELHEFLIIPILTIYGEEKKMRVCVNHYLYINKDNTQKQTKEDRKKKRQ
jgi:hypothetical protein